LGAAVTYDAGSAGRVRNDDLRIRPGNWGKVGLSGWVWLLEKSAVKRGSLRG